MAKEPIINIQDYGMESIMDSTNTTVEDIFDVTDQVYLVKYANGLVSFLYYYSDIVMHFSILSEVGREAQLCYQNYFKRVGVEAVVKEIDVAPYLVTELKTIDLVQ